MLRQLPSCIKSVDEIKPLVENLARKYRISPDQFSNILISLAEAVTNAITHGNCCDESKKVEIKLRKQSDAIAISVRDQGCGFDFRNLPDPTALDNLAKCGGRGVFLMQQLSDRVDFRDDGRTVEMQFKL